MNTIEQMGTVQHGKDKVDVFFTTRFVAMGVDSKVGATIIHLTPDEAVELAELLVRTAETLDPHVKPSEWLSR